MGFHDFICIKLSKQRDMDKFPHPTITTKKYFTPILLGLIAGCESGFTVESRIQSQVNPTRIRNPVYFYFKQKPIL